MRVLVKCLYNESFTKFLLSRNVLVVCTRLVKTGLAKEHFFVRAGTSPFLASWLRKPWKNVMVNQNFWADLIELHLKLLDSWPRRGLGAFRVCVFLCEVTLSEKRHKTFCFTPVKIHKLVASEFWKALFLREECCALWHKGYSTSRSQHLGQPKEHWQSAAEWTHLPCPANRPLCWNTPSHTQGDFHNWSSETGPLTFSLYSPSGHVSSLQ